MSFVNQAGNLPINRKTYTQPANVVDFVDRKAQEEWNLLKAKEQNALSKNQYLEMLNAFLRGHGNISPETAYEMLALLGLGVMTGAVVEKNGGIAKTMDDAVHFLGDLGIPEGMMPHVAHTHIDPAFGRVKSYVPPSPKISAGSSPKGPITPIIGIATGTAATKLFVDGSGCVDKEDDDANMGSVYEDINYRLDKTAEKFNLGSDSSEKINNFYDYALEETDAKGEAPKLLSKSRLVFHTTKVVDDHYIRFDGKGANTFDLSTKDDLVFESVIDSNTATFKCIYDYLNLEKTADIGIDADSQDILDNLMHLGVKIDRIGAVECRYYEGEEFENMYLNTAFHTKEDTSGNYLTGQMLIKYTNKGTEDAPCWTPEKIIDAEILAPDGFDGFLEGYKYWGGTVDSRGYSAHIWTEKDADIPFLSMIEDDLKYGDVLHLEDYRKPLLDYLGLEDRAYGVGGEEVITEYAVNKGGNIAGIKGGVTNVLPVLNGEYEYRLIFRGDELSHVSVYSPDGEYTFIANDNGVGMSMELKLRRGNVLRFIDGGPSRTPRFADGISEVNAVLKD